MRSAAMALQGHAYVRTSNLTLDYMRFVPLPLTRTPAGRHVQWNTLTLAGLGVRPAQAEECLPAQPGRGRQPEPGLFGVVLDHGSLNGEPSHAAARGPAGPSAPAGSAAPCGARPGVPYRLVYQVEVLLVGTERLLKEPLLHGGPDVRAWGRRPGGGRCLSSGREPQTTLPFRLPAPSSENVPSLLPRPVSAASRTTLTKTLAGGDCDCAVPTLLPQQLGSHWLTSQAGVGRAASRLQRCWAPSIADPATFAPSWPAASPSRLGRVHGKRWARGR